MINEICKFFSVIIDIPITVFFNFYYFPVKQAIKFPIIVSHKIRLQNMGKRGCLKVQNITPQCINLGRTGSFSLGIGDKFYWNIADDAIVEFEGKAFFGRGTQIICGHGARLHFGENFLCNSQCIINSSGNLHFGKNVLIGWKSEFLTSDGHEVYSVSSETMQRKKSEIIVGDHCWIASNVTVLKGTVLLNDSIVAAKACVSKAFEESNILIGGFNKVIKLNVDWKM